MAGKRDRGPDEGLNYRPAEPPLDNPPKPAVPPRGAAADAPPPLLVTVRLGATIPLGPDKFGNVRPEAEIRNIRADATDEEVEAQIRRGIEVVGQAWRAVDDELELRVTEMMAPEAGGDRPATVRERLARVEAYIAVNKKNMGKVVEAVRSLKGASSGDEANPVQA